MSSVRTLLTVFIIILSVLEAAESAKLRCYFGSLDKHEVIRLEEPLALLESECWEPSIPTVFYTFGYRGKVAGPATTAMLSAYLATKKRNVLLLDWEDEASSGILGIPLGYALSAVPNAIKVGKRLGDVIAELAKSGLDTSRVHLLGHSLGAHVMGYAGRQARSRGYVVGRITGLDPARALYESSISLQSGLDRTCAKFVDIIHSDPGGYGTSKPGGTVDFWPNYTGGSSTQPGCPNGDFEMFSPEEYPTSEFIEYDLNSQNFTRFERLQKAMRPNLCSHDRSWRYFSEAIASPTSFMAEQAPSYESWKNNNGKRSANNYTYMGDLVSTKSRGSYFLTTNSKAPYGAGEEGLRPDDNQVKRSRRNSTLARLLQQLR